MNISYNTVQESSITESEISNDGTKTNSKLKNGVLSNVQTTPKYQNNTSLRNSHIDFIEDNIDNVSSHEDVKNSRAQSTPKSTSVRTSKYYTMKIRPYRI